MSFAGLLGTFVVLVVLFVITAVFVSNERHKRIMALPPEERDTALFGRLNDQLVCSHCQSKGAVRAKGVQRIQTSTGKFGGILKTDTRSTTTIEATQHHCGNCGTTWDVAGPYFPRVMTPPKSPVASLAPTRSLNSEEQGFIGAVETGDLTIVQQLLLCEAIAQGGSDAYGRGWLQLAAKNGTPAICKALLEARFDPDWPDSTGQTARQIAAQMKDSPLPAIFGKLHSSERPPEQPTENSAGADVKAHTQGSLATQIKELVDLKSAGALTEEEFSAAKAKLLGLSSAS